MPVPLRIACQHPRQLQTRGLLDHHVAHRAGELIAKHEGRREHEGAPGGAPVQIEVEVPIVLVLPRGAAAVVVRVVGTADGLEVEGDRAAPGEG